MKITNSTKRKKRKKERRNMQLHIAGIYSLFVTFTCTNLSCMSVIIIMTASF